MTEYLPEGIMNRYGHILELKKLRLWIGWVCFWIICTMKNANAQDISVKNPSPEGTGQVAAVPPGRILCVDSQ